MKTMYMVILGIFLLSVAAAPVSHAEERTHPSFRGMTREAAIEELVQQITEGVPGQSKMAIAVSDLLDLHGEATGLGRLLAEELTTRLFLTRRFTVREASLLNKVLSEITRGKAPVFDPSTMEKLGQILSIDAVVAGTIADLGMTIKLNARVINTRGEVIAGGLAEYIKESEDESLMKAKVPPVDFSAPPADEHPQTESESYDTRWDGGSKAIEESGSVVNGDFEQPWHTGWTRVMDRPGGGGSLVEQVAGSDGKQMHLRHAGEGFIVLYQEVLVDHLDRIFTASFQMKRWERAGADGTGLAMIELQYKAAGGEVLGSTAICNCGEVPYKDTPLVGSPAGPQDSHRNHYHRVEAKRYEGYSLHLREEVTNNLLAIDPQEVKKLVIVLFAGAARATAGAELYVDDIRLTQVKK